MVSSNNQVSTTFSSAEQHTKAQAESLQIFRKVGAGACGAVFGQDGQSLVWKLAKSEGELISYFDAHLQLIKAAEGVCNLPTSALVTERILPLPSTTRNLLVEKFCAPRIKEKACADIANTDCLVRVYLGSMQGKTNMKFFSLRNFKLHLNHMLEIKLDVEAIVRRMGIAMAVLHWAAKTDARDVEFVLGSSTRKTTAAVHDTNPRTIEPETYTGPLSFRDEVFFSRVTELWILDFNQVRTITMDDEGVKLAVEAWRINDPHFPKPLRETPAERHVWEAFVITYLEASDAILKEEKIGKDALALPRKFIHGITEAERTRMMSRMGD
ncbi:zinc finger protein-domain-containing protein [Lasiosphaeris hirsuta]|uniref:Zinc finger protein-domain-containing protein n=1 Tax=Lasiosphaeris hirsuta TaxID=260670 RepID=A0AA40B1G7_9PEZI|nr:zinc finger protein-domain-containing protein [Lasiosphaeris hirsuta]